MRVSIDRSAPDTNTRTTAPFPPIAFLSRASLAGALLALVPASLTDQDASRRPDASEANVRALEVSFGGSLLRADATDIADVPADTSLIGKTVRIPGEREGMPDMIVRIEKGPNGITIEVDGKEYGIDDSPLLPNVTLANVIDDARLTKEIVTLISKEYGTATVKLADVRYDLGRLSSSEHPTVDASVPAEFEAKEGTLLARSLGLAKAANDARKNMLAWMGGTTQEPARTPTYELTFRRNNPTALASAR